MKQSPESSRFSKWLPIYATLLIAGIATVILMLPRESGTPPVVEASKAPMADSAQGEVNADSRAEPARIPVKPPVSPEVVAAQGRRFDWFTLRPFAVAKSSGAHEWTREDGKGVEAISAIAHNQAEVQRMLDENSRILRRQLVYRKEPAFIAIQKTRADGRQLQTLVLPGFDGQDIEMEVVKADLDPSGLRGTLAGRLPGRGLSMVTLAFKEGREAFSVISPEDGIYLQAHPREPGEIILTSFDPGKYMPLPGGEPIRTAQSSTPQK